MVSLAGGLIIQLLVIYYSAWLTITLGLDYHPAAPFQWDINRYLFNDPKSDVHLQTSLNSFLPVKRNLSWVLYSNRFSIFVDMEAEGRRVLHER